MEKNETGMRIRIDSKKNTIEKTINKSTNVTSIDHENGNEYEKIKKKEQNT